MEPGSIKFAYCNLCRKYLSKKQVHNNHLAHMFLVKGHPAISKIIHYFFYCHTKKILELRFRVHKIIQSLWKMPLGTEFMKCVELLQFISTFRSWFVNRNSMTHFIQFFIVCIECHVVWANFELLDGRYLSLMYQIMTWTPPLLPLISFVSRVWNFLIIRWIVLELHKFFFIMPFRFLSGTET